MYRTTTCWSLAIYKTFGPRVTSGNCGFTADNDLTLLGPSISQVEALGSNKTKNLHLHETGLCRFAWHPLPIGGSWQSCKWCERGITICKGTRVEFHQSDGKKSLLTKAMRGHDLTEDIFFQVS